MQFILYIKLPIGSLKQTRKYKDVTAKLRALFYNNTKDFCNEKSANRKFIVNALCREITKKIKLNRSQRAVPDATGKTASGR